MLIDWFTVGAQVVNFLILLFLLKKFLYGPITRAMAAREAKIQEKISQAENRRQEAAREEEKIQQRLQELEDIRRDMADKMKAEVAQRRKDLLAEARQEVEDHRRSWLQSLSREKQSLAQSVQKRYSHQVFTLTRLLLQQLSDVSLEERFLQVFFDRLQSLPSEDEEAFRESLGQSGEGVTVTSAFPLSEENRSRLREALQDRFGSQVTPQFKTDPSLIAGLEVKTSSSKLSWAVDGTLHNLEENVMENLVPLPREESHDR